MVEPLVINATIKDVGKVMFPIKGEPIQKKGYQIRQRLSGSYWYLCDYCQAQAYVTNDEQEMIDHVKRVHECI